MASEHCASRLQETRRAMDIPTGWRIPSMTRVLAWNRHVLICRNSVFAKSVYVTGEIHD